MLDQRSTTDPCGQSLLETLVRDIMQPGPGTASVQVQVWCGWLVNACVKEAQVLVEKQAELWEAETES